LRWRNYRSESEGPHEARCHLASGYEIVGAELVVDRGIAALCDSGCSQVGRWLAQY
jgi:hypothetical protein